jgi:hypothetical protein
MKNLDQMTNNIFKIVQFKSIKNQNYKIIAVNENYTKK